jgi:GxxExxY protein
VTENEVARVIVDSAFAVHTELGPGLLESVYEGALSFELTRRGLTVQRQCAMRATYAGADMGEGFRCDLFVERLVIVEIKSVDLMSPVFAKQLLTYLKLTGCRLGLLINFNVVLIKDGIRRVANNLPD